MFVDRHEKSTILPIILDERLFSDTVIRVVQMKPSEFMACDIRYLNGTNVYEKMNYAARHALLESLLDTFHTTELTALMTDPPSYTLLHGFECYDDEPGTLGVFLPARE